MGKNVHLIKEEDRPLGVRARPLVFSFYTDEHRGKTWCMTPYDKADVSVYFPFYFISERSPFMSSYYLGVDVSKGYSDFVILDEHKRERPSSSRYWGC